VVCELRVARSFLLSRSSGAIGFAFGHGRAPLPRGAEEQPPSAFIDSLATVRLAFGGAGLAGARVPSGFAAAGFIRIANALWQFAKALAEHAAKPICWSSRVVQIQAVRTRFAGSRRGREAAAL
jgi:hypothetical protein